MLNQVFDPNDFIIVPHVAVIDEFRMTDETGGLVAIVDSRYLAKLVQHMREREDTTGDVSPIIIGHTSEDPSIPETERPPVIGIVRNWVLDQFFDTDRQAAFADFWFYKTSRIVVDGVEQFLTPQEINRLYPRRSAEVWPDRYEADPVSVLGPTTPARDLGHIKLSRGGSFTFFSPGDLIVPDPIVKDPKPLDDANASVGNLPVLQQILATLQQLVAAQTKDVPPPEDVPGDKGAPGEGEMTDEELEKLLSEGGDEGNEPPPEEDESRKGKEPPVKNDGYPGGVNTNVAGMKVKLARLPIVESELAQTKTQVAKLELKNQLNDLRVKQNLDVNPDDDALLSDLAAMPPDMRQRQIERIQKNSRPLPTGDSFHLSSAFVHSTNGDKKRVPSMEENKRIIQLARQKGVQYESAAAELGYQIQ